MDKATLPDDALITAAKAREHELGGISDTTEWRWADQFSDFPRPVRINGRKFYRVRDLRAFIARREADGRSQEAA